MKNGIIKTYLQGDLFKQGKVDEKIFAINIYLFGDITGINLRPAAGMVA
jgi:hypothetical protein